MMSLLQDINENVSRQEHARHVELQGSDNQYITKAELNMSKYGGYWCEKHEKKHTELTMGYYGCKTCYDELLKKNLEEGLQQIKDGKGITTEEVKERLATLKERMRGEG